MYSYFLDIVVDDLRLKSIFMLKIRRYIFITFLQPFFATFSCSLVLSFSFGICFELYCLLIYLVMRQYVLCNLLKWLLFHSRLILIYNYTDYIIFFTSNDIVWLLFLAWFVFLSILFHWIYSHLYLLEMNKRSLTRYISLTRRNLSCSK